RRTALRDSFKCRLISRRLWPCALRSFTPLRISIGIILAIPLDVPLKAFEVSLCARERLHQLLRKRREHSQALAHPADQFVDAPPLGFALTLRADTQSLGPILRGALVERLHEQLRVLDHAFAHSSPGLLVMFEPPTQLARRQRRLPQGRQKLLGMCTAGARQRCNHPRRCPSRQPPRAHRGKARLRKRREQLQPPVDPAVVTPATAANLALRYT